MKFFGLLARRGRYGRALSIGESLRRYQRMEVVGQLTSSLAHDMNNLLHIIKGSCEVLLQNDLPPHVGVSVQQMRKAASQASGFLVKFLAFMQGNPPAAELIDIDSAVRDMEVLLRFALRKNVRLEVDLDASSSTIAMDRIHFEQLVLNLILNARDALSQGGKIVVRTRAFPISGDGSRSSRLPAGDYVSLEVSDNGCGIDMDIGVHMFEPFFTTKEPAEGTGLGLSIVQQIVNFVGGELQVASARDRGTSVRVVLPEGSNSSAKKKAGPSKNTAVMPRRASQSKDDFPHLWSEQCWLAMAAPPSRKGC